MAISARYLVSQKNVDQLFEKVKAGAVPEKFTNAHLVGLGFTSTNDRGFLGVLKDLGFLTPDGTPTQRYKDFRDRTQSGFIMAAALREMYSDLFLLNEKDPTQLDKAVIEGKFKSAHSSNDNIAKLQASTFLSLAAHADFGGGSHKTPAIIPIEKEENEKKNSPGVVPQTPKSIDLRYTIQIHLPATKDIEIYNSIFKSIKQNLLDD
jgi:hypothetical protein